MNGGEHERAERLIAQERIEGLSAAEQTWLAGHLRECEPCAAAAQATEQALKALRGVSVPLPRTLASRTQFRVRMRAQQMQGHEPRWRMIWLASAVSWVMGAATAPYIWRWLELAGEWTGAPKWVWQMGFGVWWALPAIVAAVIVLIEKGERLSDPS